MLFCEKTGPEKKEGSNLDVELAKRTHSMPTLHLPINIKESTILGFAIFALRFFRELNKTKDWAFPKHDIGHKNQHVEVRIGNLT